MNSKDARQAAINFVDNWKFKDGQENGQCAPFWIELLQSVFGVSGVSSYVDFERRVNGKRIDVFIEDTGVLVEQKSKGIDLTKPEPQSDGACLTPFQQAKRYADWLPYSIRPRYIITSNFSEFRIHDQETDATGEDPVIVSLDELPDHLPLFSFLTSRENSKLEKQKELSLAAGELIAKLYSEVEKQYIDADSPKTIHDLSVLCVRLVFCLYAEDSTLFGRRGMLEQYLKRFSAEEMREALIRLFKVLNTPEDERDPYDPDYLLEFPYVNGGLFEEVIEIPKITNNIRFHLIHECAGQLNWSKISPVIFGAIFESTINPETRRSGGMHYTSVENIHKVIDPLFLDDLKTELNEILGLSVQKTRHARLRALQEKIAALKFFDPACGSGNFLTESYLSLRILENRIIESLQGNLRSYHVDGEASLIKVTPDQFYGIEINEFAVSVARTALWIAEAQMVEATEEIISGNINALPLKNYGNIIKGDALVLGWESVVGGVDCDYIMGNPPFVGSKMQSELQKQQIMQVYDGAKNAGEIDYVAAWFMKAAKYLAQNGGQAAFVATNSICQGEQVANIWKPITDLGIHIKFAHRTFRWDSDAGKTASVYCVIVGITKEAPKKPLRIFEYSMVNGPYAERLVSRINPYLLDGPTVLIYKRRSPLCDVPEMGIGNKPIDGGHYLFTEQEMLDFVKIEPLSVKYFKKWLGSDEFINSRVRYCLWLGDCTAAELIAMPECMKRVQAVKEFRLSSKSAPTRKLASNPTRFHVENMPDNCSVLVPEVSSERRKYIPVGFVGPDVLCSNLVRLVPNASLYHFGVLTSRVHNAWMRVVAGRLESRYRYSAQVVYNNFVWPTVADDVRESIAGLARRVLDARELYADSTLAQLYDPEYEFLYPELIAAHKRLDEAVENAYGFEFGSSEEQIVAQLFELFKQQAD